jgi:hypothetical protein
MLIRVVASLTIATALGAATPTPILGPYGRGAAQVWVLQPAGPVRDVVVFGHGWKHAAPSPSYPWVGQFRPWLEHLLANGSAIIFPRYQLGYGDAVSPERVRAFEDGVRLGYLELGRPQVPFVSVGYSFGASLSFYYAADASSLHLPVPRAVMAIFPAGMVGGARLRTLPPRVRVLIQVGDRDVTAGRGGANAFWARLAGHPKKRYEVIHSTATFSADHTAPKQTSSEARRAFWQALDRLIAEALRQ